MAWCDAIAGRVGGGSGMREATISIAALGLARPPGEYNKGKYAQTHHRADDRHRPGRAREGRELATRRELAAQDALLAHAQRRGEAAVGLDPGADAGEG